MTALSTKQDRWTIINQTFRSSFLTFSLVELTRRGAGIIDGLFVSNFLSVNEIASVGIAKIVFTITTILSGLFSMGMQNKCSYELGKGDTKSFNIVFCTLFYIAAAVSAIFGALLFITALPVAMLLGASGKGAELADGAATYLRGSRSDSPHWFSCRYCHRLCNLTVPKTECANPVSYSFCQIACWTMLL